MASAGPAQSPEAWADRVRAAAPAGFAGPWPRLSIWQGQADRTVAPENGTLLATQWCALHGLSSQASDERVRDGVLHRMWPDAARRQVELWLAPHLAHAYPARGRDVEPGRFVEPAPIDATTEIARFFALD